MSVTKKSKDVGEHNYKIGDIVLAKIRGYPPWPAMIVDPDNVPPAVAKERQSSKKTKFYCARFFPVGDYSWLVAKDLSLLQKHEIQAYINEPHKKSGDLLAGYKVALDPSEWEASLAERDSGLTEANEESPEELEQYDQLDEDEEEPKKKTKKRKRESEVKPKKKKDSGSGDKKSSAGTESKEKKAASRKRPSTSKKNGIRSQEAVESEDENAAEPEGVGAAGSSKKGVPIVKKPRKDKTTEEGELAHLANDPDAVRVRDWRHKLQRAFLSKVPVQLEDMTEHDQLFKTIESHELTIEQLQYSKLGKVMRHISSLEAASVPNEEKYQIRSRAHTLLEKWQGMIATETAPGGVNGAGAAVKKQEAKKDGSDKKEGTQEEKPVVNGEGAAQNPTTEQEYKLSTDVPQVDPTAEGKDDLKMDMSD